MRRIETTDGRFMQIMKGVWWDRVEGKRVEEEVIDAHMADGVGIVVLNRHVHRCPCGCGAGKTTYWW